MLLHKKIRKYTIVGLMQDEHKKQPPHVVPTLFKRYPSIAHMRDPLDAGSAAYTLARFVVEDGRPGPQPA